MSPDVLQAPLEVNLVGLEYMNDDPRPAPSLLRQQSPLAPCPHTPCCLLCRAVDVLYAKVGADTALHQAHEPMTS